MSYIMIPLVSTACTALETYDVESTYSTLNGLVDETKSFIYNLESEALGRKTAGLWVQ